MSSQAAETPLKYVEFLALGLGEYETLGVYSDGTRVTTLSGSVRKGYLITDLTAPSRFSNSTMKIERMGKTSVTIVLNGLSGAAVAALSPILPDPTIANYIAFASVDDSANPLAWAGYARVVSTSQLGLHAYRSFQAQSNTTGLTVAGNDLTDIDVTTQNPHGANAGFFPHNHTTTGHPVTDPGHFHNFTAAAVAVNVDWLIMHV